MKTPPKRNARPKPIISINISSVGHNCVRCLASPVTGVMSISLLAPKPGETANFSIEICGECRKELHDFVLTPARLLVRKPTTPPEPLKDRIKKPLVTK